VGLIIASFIPIAFTIFLSFTNWNQFHPALAEGFHAAGFANYKHILDSASGEFLGVFTWTLLFAGISTATCFTIGLVLAFLLNNPHMTDRNVYRTILILPWALPGLMMLLPWYGLLQTTNGQINAFLALAHLGPVDWLGDPNWAKFSILLVNTWLGYPFMMTACLGALQSIPNDIVEAAEVDGANTWVRFSRIVFPLLRSATLPLVIGTFAFNMNNFGVVYFLTAGGPQTNLLSNAGSTDILPSYTYNLAQSHFLYALAAAYSVVIFFIIGGIRLVNMKLSNAFQEVER